jgi:hypothetical protein
VKISTLASVLLAGGLAACGGGGDGTTSAPGAPAGAGPAQGAATDGQPLKGALTSAGSLLAPLYAIDFVATAASGFDLNDAGDVVGKSYPDPGCGPFCLPPQEAVVWKGGERMVLPPVAGFDGFNQHPRFINNAGLVAGVAGWIGVTTHAALWKPEGTGYVAQDLGLYPGTSSVDVFGLDDQGRLVGWATLGGAIPSIALPFVWTQATGMLDLKALGYPNERPAAMSPGGKVVTWGSWYQLGDPASVRRLPPPPLGFVGAGSNGSAVNDFGDQAHFLVTTGSQNLVYPFRLPAGGSWQQISDAGTGQMSRANMGSITPAQDVTFTALGTGMAAAGPAGLGQPLAARVSPAYGGATVGDAGPVNAAGQILAQVMVGRSQRLVKLTPVTGCTADCLVSRSLTMAGKFVEDPALPGSCVAGGKMYNLASVSLTITSETGAPLANVQVSGRFLDDYWTDQQVSGTTNASGVASWNYRGTCGVGAIAFLVDNASLGTRAFDRTQGTLTGYVIPTAGVEAPPAGESATNAPPVAVVAVTCKAGRTCTFTGSGSHDPDGSIAGYRWTGKAGALWSTEAVFTRTFDRAGKESVVLQVTDNGGLSASKKVTFTVLR